MDLSLIIDIPTPIKKQKRNSNIRRSNAATEGDFGKHRRSQSPPEI